MRLWLGLACGLMLAAAPCASAQDLNTALAAYNCGTPAAPPTPPNGARATAQQMQSFAEHAQQWQAAQQQLGQCLQAAQNAMDARTQARVDEFNQRSSQGAQASAAWQAAAGESGHQ
jgi:hypothetical protein